MFTTPNSHYYTEITGSFSPYIVMLAVLVIAFASYTAFTLYGRMFTPSFLRRDIWLLLASVSLTFGIWAMHFILMNAVILPFEMHGDVFGSVLSSLPALLTAALTFHLIRTPVRVYWRSVAAALILTEGMMLMHFIGMNSMKTEAAVFYDWHMLAASNIAAALFVYLSLRCISAPAGTQIRKGIAVIFMTIGVTAMHAVWLAGTSYFLNESAKQGEIHNSSYILNSLIIIGTGLLLFALLLMSYIDRYVDYWLKYFDVLTKLPNRRNWERTLSQKPSFGDLALWSFPDLHRLNQLQGYAEGDKILREIGTVLVKWKPPFTRLYRVSGNRYLICSEQFGRSAEFYKSLVLMQQEIDRITPFQNQQMRYVCGVSAADREQTPKQLYEEALLAVEQATADHEWGIIKFDSSVHGSSYEREVLRDVRKALDEKQFHLLYQPKVKGREALFAGAEALLRWTHPELGPLSPAVFVPILEKDGRMGEVTDWIIQEVCRQMDDWDKAGFYIPHVAINIPGEYITDPNLLNVLWSTTEQYGLDPGRIELEITETTTAKSLALASAAVKRFKLYGFSVALDDFGTGVSSLSYLQQLPINTLKIDKSFIDYIPAAPKECAVLTSILAIGRSLELDIVIEGVEKQEQVDFLLDLQQDLMFQGYHFSKPLSPGQLIKWTKAHKNIIGQK